MNFLVIGSGGREHALCRALKASPTVNSVFVAPGNDGMTVHAERLDIDPKKHDSVIEACKRFEIDCVVIGPEAELVDGLADSLRQSGISVVGPNRTAAQLEGSKVFAKQWMVKNGIPTARAVTVHSVSETIDQAKSFSRPFVLKANGLAAGKGVIICKNIEELEKAAKRIFVDKEFGAAGAAALLEEFLPGKELSVLVLTNGSEYRLLPLCRDHKRLKDKDVGPNTGGMGVVGPMEIDKELLQSIEELIVRPSVEGLKKDGYLFRGVLFIGIMLTDRGPSVLEYNVRFGDPEAQVILSLLDGDWGQVLSALSEGALLELRWKNEFRTCVVLASEGYPESPKKGVMIEGDLDSDTGKSYVLHAGTRRRDSHFETNGGRVLNVIGCGSTLEESQKNAYERVSQIKWPGMQFRSDIGR